MRKFRPKPLGRRLWYSCLFLFTGALFISPVCAAPAGEGFLVGRISHVEGQLLRYVPAEKDWVATVRDAPFGMDDALHSDQNGKAEFIMPNRTWVRIGGSTQIQLIALKADVTGVDVASGVARFHNRSSNALIKATTPFGYVVGQPGSAFDLYVGDESAEVISLSGKVDFLHSGDNARYEVVQGSSSLIADASQVGSGEPGVDASWDDWNEERDNLWSKRMSVKGDSVRYLPEVLHDEAYQLEENGRWETVSYEGKKRSFWRPTRVDSGWAPFTAGRWTEYYGDNTWIPDEPFGYPTHHYGNWVYVNNAWYWGPPQTVGVGSGWYPGRVAWIGSGADVGWVPLAPRERYYSHYAWGPAATVIGAAAVVGLTIGSLAYLNHAVVVPQHDFYGVNNYSRVRVANINRTTIINNYQAAPVVSSRIFRSYDTDRNRYRFTDAQVVDRPHNTVLRRIEYNHGIAKQEGPGINARTLGQNMTRTRPTPLPTETRVAPPKVSNRIVPVSQVDKPASEIGLQPRALKEKSKRVQPPKQGAEGPPAAERRRGVPAEPGKRLQPTEAGIAERGSTTTPKAGEKARTGRTGQPAESGVPPKSPRDRRAKPGKAEPRAPGADPESLQEQRQITPPESETRPQVQGEERPDRQRQRPAVQREPRPQQQQERMQQPQPRQEPQSQPEPQRQRPAVQREPRPQKQQERVQQPQPRREPQSQPEPQRQRPAVQREPRPQQQQERMQQPQPRRKTQPKPQQQGDDEEKVKHKGHEQQE